MLTGPADEERATGYAELLRHAANQPVHVGDEEIAGRSAVVLPSVSPAAVTCRN